MNDFLQAEIQIRENLFPKRPAIIRQYHNRLTAFPDKPGKSNAR